MAKTFQYLVNCVGCSGDWVEHLNQMIEGSTQITARTFGRHASYASVEKSLGYGRDIGLFLLTDWHVGFYKSTFGGLPAYYFVHSGIEFIFTERGVPPVPGGEEPGGRGATMSHADARAVFDRHGEDITGLDEAARSKAFRRIAFSIHPDRRPASEKDEATRDLVELNAAQAVLNTPQASGSSFTSDRPRRRRSAREPWAPANRVAEDGPAWTRSKPHPSTTVWQNEGAPIPDSAVRAWARELLEHSFVRVQSREYTPHDPRGFWTNYGSAGYFGRTFSTRTLKKDEADEGWVVAAVYEAIKNSARKWDPADLIMRLTVQAPIGQNVGHAAIAWQAPHDTVSRDFGYSTRYYSISFAPRPVRKKRIPKAQRLDRYKVESMLRAAGMKVTNPRAWKVTKWRFPDGARTLETKDRTFGSSHYGQITAADVEKDIEWARQDPRAGGRGARNVEGIPFTKAGQDSYLGIIAGRDVVAVKHRRGHWRWSVHDWPITVRFPTILGHGTSMKSAVADAVQAAAKADPRGPWGPNWGSGRAARATGKKRGAILFSGGMDSVILASIAKERGYDLIPFYMSHRANVGNVTKKEIVAASKLARTVLGRKLVIFKPPTKKTPKWYSELGLVFESDKLPVLKGDKDHRNRTFIDILHDEGMADEVVALGLFGSTRVDGKERTKARADDIIPARLSEYLKSIGGSGTILSLAEYDGPGGEAGAKERALKDLPASARKHVLASESCLMWFGKPCGDCWSCMDRVKSITAAWGKDTTPYRAESKADKHKKGGKGRGSRGRAAREPYIPKIPPHTIHVSNDPAWAYDPKKQPYIAVGASTSYQPPGTLYVSESPIYWSGYLDDGPVTVVVLDTRDLAPGRDYTAPMWETHPQWLLKPHAVRVVDVLPLEAALAKGAAYEADLARWWSREKKRRRIQTPEAYKAFLAWQNGGYRGPPPVTDTWLSPPLELTLPADVYGSLGGHRDWSTGSTGRASRRSRGRAAREPARVAPTFVPTFGLVPTEKTENQGNVEALIEVFKASEVLPTHTGWPAGMPPIFVVGGEIVDGHHRWEAAARGGYDSVLVVEADADKYEQLLAEDYPPHQALEKLTGWEHPESHPYTRPPPRPLTAAKRARIERFKRRKGLGSTAPSCPLVDIVEFYDDDTGEIVTEVHLRNAGRAARGDDPFLDLCAAIDAEEAAAKKPKRKKRTPPKPKQSRAKTGWSLGDLVVFGRRRGEKTIGQIVGGIGAKKIKIRQLAPRREWPVGTIWRVAPTLLTRYSGPRPGGAAAPGAPQAEPAQPRRTKHIRTHDLDAILAGERKWFPDGMFDDVRIKWSSGARDQLRSGVRLGTWSPTRREIKCHPTLDRPEVPEYVMRHLVYHELLHGLIGVRRHPRTGKRVMHGPDFKRLEAIHPDSARADAWTKANMGCLCGREDWSKK